VAVSATSLFFAAVALMPVAAFNLPSTTPSSEAWAAAVALGVVCTAIAFLMYFRLLKNIGPTRAMAVTYVIPVFGILWGCLFLKETVSVSTIVGGAVIVAGVVLVKWPEKKGGGSSETSPPVPLSERRGGVQPASGLPSSPRPTGAESVERSQGSRRRERNDAPLNTPSPFGEGDGG